MAKAKLRRMLGSLEDPAVTALMGLIGTQSKATLAKWALEYVQAHYWPILAAHGCADSRLAGAMEAEKQYWQGGLSLKEVKKSLADARKAAQECTRDPAAQAAARAVSTGCAVLTTPTNALGFAFYGAAAYAYETAGPEESAPRYDALAHEELERVLACLQEAAVPNEPDPVKIDWNC